MSKPRDNKRNRDVGNNLNFFLGGSTSVETFLLVLIGEMLPSPPPPPIKSEEKRDEM
jgi:hypothetical protein